MTTVNPRTYALLSAGLATTLLLTACGDNGEQPAENGENTGAQFNDTDVEFATMMIPHHEQAIEMSQLVEERAGEDVRALATEIEDAQGPEIEELTAMLSEWGEEPPAEGEDHSSMAGMLSEEEMTQLEEVSGDAFDALFLGMMIVHHEGAIEMAEDQMENGVNPQAAEMAQEIVDTQESEIAQMREMLEDYPGQKAPSPDEDGGEDENEDGHGDH
ncbi:DUF305 domain-containing protein [Spiractinospora alimapuensis]|uniref:DUF305 domain-containing protein n=1 Tax=Spiractinospora alimapuensis TaxID=2820884 RepID=UPI001F4637FF|nr:DUF305 domain-containing protein [Spiractinospora alimapuensis]QVQ53476.1 DUF305 domain-containing protein [Spiractinospora alimapuensis]